MEHAQVNQHDGLEHLQHTRLHKDTKGMTNYNQDNHLGIHHSIQRNFHNWRECVLSQLQPYDADWTNILATKTDFILIFYFL